MEFKINTKELLPILSKAIIAVDVKGVMPIIQNYYFDVKKDKLTVKATNLEKAYLSEAKIEADKEKQFLIPGKLLLDLVKNLSGDLTFKSTPQKMKLITEGGEYNLSVSYDVEDYPEIPEIDEEIQFSISKEELTKGINFTEYAISKEEIRPSMTGVLMEVSGENITFVSTDGHRLALKSMAIKIKDKTTEVIVPGSCMDAMLQMEDGVIEVSIAKSHIKFSNSKEVLISRLIGKKYVNYKKILPDNKFIAEINKEQFLRSLKRITLFTDVKDQKVILNFADNVLTISGQNVNNGCQAEETIEVKYNEEPMKLAFYPRYLFDAFHSYEENNLKLMMSSPFEAVTLRGSDETDFCLIMPKNID